MYVLQDGGTGIIQKVDLFSNTITAGDVGVRIQRTGGTSVLRQVTIGGAVTRTNRISGNSTYEVQLQGSSPPPSWLVRKSQTPDFPAAYFPAPVVVPFPPASPVSVA